MSRPDCSETAIDLCKGSSSRARRLLVLPDHSLTDQHTNKSTFLLFCALQISTMKADVTLFSGGMGSVWSFAHYFLQYIYIKPKI